MFLTKDSENNKGKYIDPTNADIYQKNSRSQFHHAKSFLAPIAHLVKGPLLDVGCGTGEISIDLFMQFLTPTYAIDISEDRITHANQSYGQAVTYVVGDATQLDNQKVIASIPFGTVFSFNTLHHMASEKQLQAFTQIRKILKPDGIAMLLIPGRSPELHDAINEIAGKEKWKLFFHNFDLKKVRTYESPEYYYDLCMQAGFQSCTVRSSIEIGGGALDFTGMKKYLSGWLPHLAHLKTCNMHEKSYEEVSDNFLSEVAGLYFCKLHLDVNEDGHKIEPQITQNKIIAFASRIPFFKPRSSTNTTTSPVQQVCKL